MQATQHCVHVCGHSYGICCTWVFLRWPNNLGLDGCRDKQTKESRGFAFIAYEDQRSTNLAVDNLNGFTVAGRMMAVDHVKDYKRLVDNPDAVHNPEAEPSTRALPAQDAGPGPVDGSRLRQDDAAATPAQGFGPGAGGSLADMLADAEKLAEEGDWRQRGRKRSSPQRDAHDDPMADFVHKKHRRDKKQKKEKHSKERHKKSRRRSHERNVSPR